MRFLIAIILSILLHLGIVVCLMQKDSPQPAVKKNQSHAINIFIKKTTVIAQPLIKLARNDALKPLTKVKNIPALETTKTHPLRNLAVIQQESSLAVKLDKIEQKFYSTPDLERKALPISNINTEMLEGVLISGIPIKLRLYINALGKVSTIQELVVLEQDRPFADRLKELLLNTTFLAAKKNGLDVNSYQDIEFSFNPFFILPTQVGKDQMTIVPEPPLNIEAESTKPPLNR